MEKINQTLSSIQQQLKTQKICLEKEEKDMKEIRNKYNNLSENFMSTLVEGFNSISLMHKIKPETIVNQVEDIESWKVIKFGFLQSPLTFIQLHEYQKLYKLIRDSPKILAIAIMETPNLSEQDIQTLVYSAIPSIFSHFANEYEEKLFLIFVNECLKIRFVNYKEEKIHKILTTHQFLFQLLLMYCQNSHSYKYLISALKEPILDVIQTTNLKFTLVNLKDDNSQNDMITKKIVWFCKFFIVELKEKLKLLPQGIRWIASRILKISQKFKIRSHSIIRSFVFYIFLKPFILFPEKFSIIDDIPISKFQRKNLQELSKGFRKHNASKIFGENELNSFLDIFAQANPTFSSRMKEVKKGKQMIDPKYRITTALSTLSEIYKIHEILFNFAMKTKQKNFSQYPKIRENSIIKYVLRIGKPDFLIQEKDRKKYILLTRKEKKTQSINEVSSNEKQARNPRINLEKRSENIFQNANINIFDNPDIKPEISRKNYNLFEEDETQSKNIFNLEESSNDILFDDIEHKTPIKYPSFKQRVDSGIFSNLHDVFSINKYPLNESDSMNSNVPFVNLTETEKKLKLTLASMDDIRPEDGNNLIEILKAKRQLAQLSELLNLSCLIDTTLPLLKSLPKSVRKQNFVSLIKNIEMDATSEFDLKKILEKKYRYTELATKYEELIQEMSYKQNLYNQYVCCVISQHFFTKNWVKLKSFKDHLYNCSTFKQLNGGIVKFFQSIQDLILSDKMCTSFQGEDYKITSLVENYLLCHVYDEFFYPKFQSQLEKKDSDFSLKMTQIRRLVSPAFLQIPDDLWDESVWVLPILELSKVIRFKPPLSKAKVFCKSAQYIKSILFFRGREDAGADLVLPIIIYLIIISNPPNFPSNMKFIELFLDHKLLDHTQEYWFTISQSAFSYLNNLQLKTVQEFVSNFEEENQNK